MPRMGIWKRTARIMYDIVLISTECGGTQAMRNGSDGDGDGDGDDERGRRSGGRPVAVRDWPPGAGPKKRIAPPSEPPATTRNSASCSVSGRGDVDVVVIHGGADLRSNSAAGVQVNHCTLSRQDSAGADCIDHRKPSPRKSPRFKELLVVEPLQVVDAAARRTPTAKRERMTTRTTPRKRKEAIAEVSTAEVLSAAAATTPKKNVEKRPSPADRAKSKKSMEIDFQSRSEMGSKEGSKENVAAKVDRESVRGALRTYDILRRMFAREQKSPGMVKRPDLKAASLMKDKQQWINNKGSKFIGSVPGVEVGDHFWYRIELCLVGLHRQIQAGIDCTVSLGQHHGGVSLATSICASGGYENAFEDGSETLIYTGQGGINYKGDKKQREDQKLERGNLALSNSQEKKNLVRVIRGLKDKTSPSGTTYIYDGLYKVVSSWVEKGVAGYGVYKFKLQRQPGQAETGTEMIKFLGLQKEADTSSSSSAPPPREGLILGDLSGGREQVPVCLVNQLGTETPHEFEYLTGVVYPGWLAREDDDDSSRGCCCKCSNGGGGGGGCCKGWCTCMARNRPPELAYTKNGSLVEARSVIYECANQCECSASSCYNRVVSQGKLKYRLEVFKSKSRGWGVRSWDFIPCGSFVGEYIGEVIDSQEAERRDNDEYLFDLDCIEILEGGEAHEAEGGGGGGGGLWLDASRRGNVARFINHSCSPNLFVQPVVYGHHGLRAPHVALFAMENILPMKELTYDYGHRKSEGDGETTQECHCGSSYCRGRLY